MVSEASIELGELKDMFRKKRTKEYEEPYEESPSVRSDDHEPFRKISEGDGASHLMARSLVKEEIANALLEQELEKERSQNERAKIMENQQLLELETAKWEAEREQLKSELRLKEKDVRHQADDHQAVVKKQAEKLAKVEENQQLLQDKLTQLMAELSESERKRQEQSVARTELADVLLEAKQQAREIVAAADYEATLTRKHLRETQASIEGDARDIYQRLCVAKNTTEMSFDALLERLNDLANLTIETTDSRKGMA